MPRTGKDAPPVQRALVLGAGGVLGAAWMTGALAALQQRLPIPVQDCDLIVGTSAGSILAAALRCGQSADDLVAHQRGAPPGLLSTLCAPDLGCDAKPPVPPCRPGSPRLLLATLRAPRQTHPWVAAAACLPPGRAEHAVLRALVTGLHQAHGARGWPAGEPTWITAVDYDSGARVVFGQPGSPPASLVDAVTASCSVPGWYRPTVIAGRRYVDGGVRSGTNADLLVPVAPADVYVLAPAASLVSDRPQGFSERTERWIRGFMTRALLRELALLRAAGCRLNVLTPGPEDLRAMGGNLMDARRRQEVFETSLRTVAATLDRGAPGVPHQTSRPRRRWLGVPPHHSPQAARG
jgi:NTE family protein